MSWCRNSVSLRASASTTSCRAIVSSVASVAASDAVSCVAADTKSRLGSAAPMTSRPPSTAASGNPFPIVFPSIVRSGVCAPSVSTAGDRSPLVISSWITRAPCSSSEFGYCIEYVHIWWPRACRFKQHGRKLSVVPTQQPTQGIRIDCPEAEAQSAQRLGDAALTWDAGYDGVMPTVITGHRQQLAAGIRPREPNGQATASEPVFANRTLRAQGRSATSRSATAASSRVGTPTRPSRKILVTALVTSGAAWPSSTAPLPACRSISRLPSTSSSSAPLARVK